MFKLLLCLLIVSTVGYSQSDDVNNTQKAFVGINSSLSYLMLDPNQNLRKELILLEARQKNPSDDKMLYIGTSIIAIGDYQKSNVNSKFGYLMRHPTSSNQIGFEVSEAVLHSWHFSVMGQLNNWITTCVELLYNPEQSFGTGTITDLNRNQIQLRKGFILLGDLNKSPFYFSLGKMDGPFGQMGTVSPFTNSTTWHAFATLGYGAQLGFKSKNFNAAIMAVQGGSQFRALNTSVAGTNVPSRINNGIADINYSFNFNDRNKLKLGGSYVLGCTYCHAFPVEHFNPCDETNPAYTVYGQYFIKDKLRIQGSYTQTVNVGPGTHNPIPPLDVFAASKVSALDIGAKYDFKMTKTENIVYSVSGEFSNFLAGAPGSNWEFQNQYVLGFAGLVNKSSRIFLEVFRTEGFVPLNFVSGGNMGPGQTISDRSAKSHGIVIGAMVTF